MISYRALNDAYERYAATITAIQLSQSGTFQLPNCAGITINARTTCRIAMMQKIVPVTRNSVLVFITDKDTNEYLMIASDRSRERFCRVATRIRIS